MCPTPGQDTDRGRKKGSVREMDRSGRTHCGPLHLLVHSRSDLRFEHGSPLQ